MTQIDAYQEPAGRLYSRSYAVGRGGRRRLQSGGGMRNLREGGKAEESREGQDAIWVRLMMRVRNGDRAAFAALFDHFAPRVKAFLMKGGAGAAQAEDLAQEVMAALWTKAPLYDPARASVATWVFTIARNRRIDTIRRQRRAEPEDLGWGPEGEPDQEDVLALQEDSERLREALKVLPEAQREMIERAYFGDLSHGEIAAETGLPMGTIKSRLRLALDRLRHAMGPRE